MNAGCIQLFQERLSEKVHATIPKGIVVDFEFTVFQRNFKDLTATVSGKVHRSYPILPMGIVARTVFLTTFLETAVCTVHQCMHNRNLEIIIAGFLVACNSKVNLPR